MQGSTVSKNPSTSVRPSLGPGRSSFRPGSRTGAAEGRRIPNPMVSGMKKSDEAVLPVKAANKGAQAPAEAAGGKGLNQGESARPKHAPDAGSGRRVTGGRADTASCNEKTAGETDCALAPHHDGRATVRLLRLAEDRIGWRGWIGVEGVRRRTGRATARPARTRTFRSVSGAAVATGCNTETGRRDTTARHNRPGRQGRPEGGSGCYPDADLRAGISRVQLRVPTGARGA